MLAVKNKIGLLVVSLIIVVSVIFSFYSTLEAGNLQVVFFDHHSILIDPINCIESTTEINTMKTTYSFIRINTSNIFRSYNHGDCMSFKFSKRDATTITTITNHVCMFFIRKI